MSNALWPHGWQHARPPCPSPAPGAYSNSCPSSRWCLPTVSSSDVPFFSYLQSFPYKIKIEKHNSNKGKGMLARWVLPSHLTDQKVGKQREMTWARPGDVDFTDPQISMIISQWQHRGGYGGGNRLTPPPTPMFFLRPAPHVLQPPPRRIQGSHVTRCIEPTVYGGITSPIFVFSSLNAMQSLSALRQVVYLGQTIAEWQTLPVQRFYVGAVCVLAKADGHLSVCEAKDRRLREPGDHSVLWPSPPRQLHSSSGLLHFPFTGPFTVRTPV